MSVQQCVLYKNRTAEGGGQRNYSRVLSYGVSSGRPWCNDRQVLVTPELRHLLLALQLYRRGLHLHPRVTDLKRVTCSPD